MVIFWAAAMVVFLILEAATVGLAAIWFAVGSLAALLSALLDAPLWLQIVWFVLVSGVLLWLTRPLAMKYVNSKRQPTNADRLIGAEGIVTQRIDNVAAAGTVAFGGKTWTARSVTGEVIDAGTLVTAEAIEGVKLMVRPSAPKGAERAEIPQGE